jgi:hypothetical protein
MKRFCIHSNPIATSLSYDEKGIVYRAVSLTPDESILKMKDISGPGSLSGLFCFRARARWTKENG